MICLLTSTKIDYLSLHCIWGIQLLIKNMYVFLFAWFWVFLDPSTDNYKGVPCEASQGKLCTGWKSLGGTAVTVSSLSSWPHTHILAFLPQVLSFLGLFIWGLLQALLLSSPFGGGEGDLEVGRSSPLLVLQYFPTPSLSPLSTTQCRDSELPQQWDNPATYICADPSDGTGELVLSLV